VIVCQGYRWRRHRLHTPREVPLSGFLLAVLIAVWAVVLVPMWAHRQSPPESEFAPDARVITRRPDRAAPVTGQHSARSGSFRVHQPPRRTAATLRRRRIVLAALTGVLLVTSIAVLAGFPFPALALPVVPYVGYVTWLRRSAAASAARRQALRRRVAAARAAGFRDFAGAPAPAVAADPTPQPATAPAAAQPTPAGPLPGTPSDAPWLPVPVPLPSYVTAAPAPAVIDDDWHEETLLDGDLPGEASAYALGDDVLRRRAVGD
jgi:hypothetical protein